jgi:hypothetical protein
MKLREKKWMIEEKKNKKTKHYVKPQCLPYKP